MRWTGPNAAIGYVCDWRIRISCGVLELRLKSGIVSGVSCRRGTVLIVAICRIAIGWHVSHVLRRLFVGIALRCGIVLWLGDIGLRGLSRAM